MKNFVLLVFLIGFLALSGCGTVNGNEERESAKIEYSDEESVNIECEISESDNQMDLDEMEGNDISENEVVDSSHFYIS